MPSSQRTVFLAGTGSSLGPATFTRLTPGRAAGDSPRTFVTICRTTSHYKFGARCSTCHEPKLASGAESLPCASRDNLMHGNGDTRRNTNLNEEQVRHLRNTATLSGYLMGWNPLETSREIGGQPFSLLCSVLKAPCSTAIIAAMISMIAEGSINLPTRSMIKSVF